MAKGLTVLTEPSPVPLFSRELAATEKDQTGGVKVTITTASFGSGGRLEAWRSVWGVEDDRKKAWHAATQVFVILISKAGVWEWTRAEPPKTHKAILAGWLRARWKMDKLRGCIA